MLIDKTFWTDSRILDLTADARYLLIYLLTCQHSNKLRCYRLPKLYVMADVKLTKERLADAWKELIKSGMILYDDKAEIIFVKAHKYKPFTAQSQVRTAVKQVLNMASSTVFAEVITALQQLDDKYDYTELIEALQGQTQEQTADSPKANTKAVVLDPLDVANYQAEFEELWGLYPRKMGNKSRALASYVKARKEGITYEHIKERLQAYVDYIKATGKTKDYVMHGTTWFVGRRWDDDLGGDGNGEGEPARSVCSFNGAEWDIGVQL